MTTTLSFQTIRTLRQAGNLRDAFVQAQQAYNADPDNVWHRRALAGVYADLLKEASAQAAPDRLLRGLRTLADFPMESTEIRWREQVLWSVNRYLLRTDADQLPLRVLAELVALSRSFLNDGPSLVRSVWVKALLRHSKTGLDWLGLLDNGGWDAFRPDDFQSETLPNGTTFGPLLERVCTAVASQLLQTVPLLEEQACPVLSQFQRLAEQYPDWTYLPYYQAKLLFALSQPTEAMRVFLPFARSKERERNGAPFWVWTMLADLLTDDAERVIDCYAKALTCSTPDSFLVKARQKMAETLIKLGRWNEARTEIDRLVITRQREGWKLPAEVQHWLNGEAYTQAVAAPVHWYADRARAAESLLWTDQPECVGLVVAVDTEQQMVVVAIEAQEQIRFPYKRFGLSPAVGDRLAIRSGMETHTGKTRPRVYTACPSDQFPTRLAIRQVIGLLRISEKGYGFVQDVFIGAELLMVPSIVAGQLIRVDAHAAWDTRKQATGWKAFIIAENGVNSHSVDKTLPKLV